MNVLFIQIYFVDIQYEEMKAKLAEVVQDAPSAESVEPEELRKYFAKFDEEFFTFCDKGNSNSICTYIYTMLA